MAFLVASNLVACTGGERNQSGECPADEACSPLTPYGLHFTGVPLVGVPLIAAPKLTAVGGTQTIELWIAEENGDTDPLDLAFAAMTDNGDALAVAGIGTRTVVLRGVSTGKDLLRITEDDSDLLFDRFEMEAVALDRVELRPSTQETYLGGAPLGFYQGRVGFGLALLSASGERLADDSLGLTWSGPAPVRESWDSFTFADVGAGTVSATLTAAGRTGPFDIDVVGAIDGVVPLEDTFPEVVHPGDQGSVCFRATSGSLASVIGVPWSFQATGPVTEVLSLSPNCMALQANAAGEVTVTANALGRSAEVAFTVAPAGGKPAARSVAPALDEVRGERARSR